jgi:hypothetical protein
MVHLLTERMQHCGARLGGLKEKMVFKVADGKLNFKAYGACSLKFDAKDCLIEILHVSGDKVAINPEVHRMTRQYILVNNHADREAALFLDPLPPIKLMEFFTNGAGPHKYTNYKGGKAKDWDKHCIESRKAFDTLRGKLDSNDMQECGAKLKDLSQQKKQESLKKARESAQATLKQKKEKRKISLVE